MTGMTISSIKKKYKDDIFDVVVLEDYKQIAELFLDINNIYTIPGFYYYGNPDGEVYKRHKQEFGKKYDNILDWEDKQIELYNNKYEIPRVDLFISNSPYRDVKVNISDVRMKNFSKYSIICSREEKKINIGVCMTSASLYRSFDEEIVVDTVKKLLDTGKFFVNHFGFRYLSENIKDDNFKDFGSSKTPTELFEFIGGLDFLITVDTAAFHMATLLGVPYLAFFGEVHSKLRTTHLNEINGKIICNDDLKCVMGECIRCDERPCLNDYDAEFILHEVNSRLL